MKYLEYVGKVKLPVVSSPLMSRSTNIIETYFEYYKICFQNPKLTVSKSGILPTIFGY